MKIQIHDLAEGVNRVSLSQDFKPLARVSEELKVRSPVGVELFLIKTRAMVTLHAVVSVEVEMDCSRCLSPVYLRLQDEFDVLYQNAAQKGVLPRDLDELEDQVEVLDFDIDAIELDQRVREALLLAVPMQPLCREDCKGLCPQCGTNLNHTNCTCVPEVVVPRWQELASFIQQGGQA